MGSWVLPVRAFLSASAMFSCTPDGSCSMAESLLVAQPRCLRASVSSDSRSPASSDPMVIVLSSVRLRKVSSISQMCLKVGQCPDRIEVPPLSVPTYSTRTRWCVIYFRSARGYGNK